MRKMTKRNNNRVNYSQLVDLLNNWLDIQESKNVNVRNILNTLNKNLEDKLCIVPNWKEKHINVKTVSLLESLVPKDVTPQMIYTLLRRFLEPRMDSTDFRKIQNIYTLLRYYENPKEVQLLATNWKQIMNKN